MSKCPSTVPGIHCQASARLHVRGRRGVVARPCHCPAGLLQRLDQARRAAIERSDVAARRFDSDKFSSQPENLVPSSFTLVS